MFTINMSVKLTKRQQQVLDFIKLHIDEEGLSPSVREICAHFGLSSPAGIHRILNTLKEKGAIVSSPGKKRSWRPAGKIRRGFPGLPLVGRIAAGLPVEAEENLIEELPVDASALFGSDGCFALYVQGDSMMDAHITDGDIAVIKQCDDVDDGEIAAVLVESLLPEATLKIVKKRPDGIELHAANMAYGPMIFTGGDAAGVRVLGRLAGIIRRNWQGMRYGRQVCKS